MTLGIVLDLIFEILINTDLTIVLFSCRNKKEVYLDYSFGMLSTKFLQ